MEEEGLLVVVEEGEKTSSSSEEEGSGLIAAWGWGWGAGVLGKEMKRLVGIAAPMVAVTVSQFLLQVVCTMMVGHLGKLSLSSTAIASSLANVTGLSILSGMAGAVETLCGQAYGAQQYQKVGTKTYTAILSLLVVCLPLSILWMNMGKLLISLGQDPLISHGAGEFLLWLVPSLFAYAIYYPLVRYFLMQSLILPMLISSCAILAFYIPLCWVLVFKSGLGYLGGALAIDISIWLNVIFLVLYMRYLPACAKTRATISMDLLLGVGEFFRFGIPAAVMLCLEWWSFELIILLSGMLSNPQLETSVLSICLNITAALYSIPYGLSAAISTRVSNELGGGNPQGARVAVFAVMLLVVVETTIVSGTLFASRQIFGYTFSNEKEVVDYVTTMAPLVCLAVIGDSFHCVLSGIARGCGWQHVGAYANLGAYYVLGIPTAVVLGFWAKLGGKGLWIGIVIGSSSQSILLSMITGFTDWEKQATKARARLFGE